MREIKFRAWIPDIKEMVDVWEIDFNIKQITWGDDKENIWSNYFSGHKKDCEVMQYIGLRDKNGKEIYEMDIIKVDWGITEPYLIENKYDKPFVIEWRNYAYPPFDRYSPIPESIEIIGNIHQNPELLKDKV